MLIALLVRLSGGRPRRRTGVLDTLVVRTVMPLVALVLGTAALGSEIEDGTAVFLMVKPIAALADRCCRKIVVAAGLTAALVVPSIVLTGLLLGRAGSDALTIDLRLRGGVPGRRDAPTRWRSWRSASFTSRALLIGLAYTLIWEGVLAGLLEGTRFLSIRQATLGIAAALGAGDPRATRCALSVAILVVGVVIVGLVPARELEAGAVRGPRRRLNPAGRSTGPAGA